MHLSRESYREKNTIPLAFIFTMLPTFSLSFISLYYFELFSSVFFFYLEDFSISSKVYQR
jgi:hypothetical protein